MKKYFAKEIDGVLQLCTAQIEKGDVVLVDVLGNGNYKEFVYKEDYVDDESHLQDDEVRVFEGAYEDLGTYYAYPDHEEDDEMPFKVLGEILHKYGIKEDDEFDEDDKPTII